MLQEIDGIPISVSLMAGRLVAKLLFVKRRVTGERRCPTIFESHIHVLIRTHRKWTTWYKTITYLGDAVCTLSLSIESFYQFHTDQEWHSYVLQKHLISNLVCLRTAPWSISTRNDMHVFTGVTCRQWPLTNSAELWRMGCLFCWSIDSDKSNSCIFGWS